MELAKAQVPLAKTTANVSITGNLGPITVYCTPVSFNDPGSGVMSDGDIWPKLHDCNSENITIQLDQETTNEYWNFYMNATDLTDGIGHTINITDPDYRLHVNTTCNGGRTPPYTLIDLTYDLVPVCAPEADKRIGPKESVDVSFYLTVPAGIYNNTYTGDFCIFANKTGEPNVNNQTWCGRADIGSDQINVTVKKTRDVDWTLEPINFTGLTPSYEYYNATDWQGFPTNITSGAKTNIFVDLYINGTDLVNLTEAPTGAFTTVIGSDNITYSNVTDPTRTPITDKEPPVWPPPVVKKLSHDWEYPVPWGGGDFETWHLIPNRTHVYSYWNMTVPVLTPPMAPGDYGGLLSAKIVDAGLSPS